MLGAYLSIISAKSDKFTDMRAVESFYVFDESVPVAIKLDPDGKLSRLEIPKGDKPAVSLEINGRPADLQIRKDGIQFYPYRWVDTPSGYVILNSGSFSLEQLDAKLYGESKIGVVIKDASSSVSLNTGEGGPVFIKDAVTPGAGEWMAAMNELGSEATVKPGEAAFTKNGYVALRRTDGKDIHLTPPADQGGKIAWGGEKAPTDSSLWLKSLSDKNPPYIEGQLGIVTAVSRKDSAAFQDWNTIRAAQIQPSVLPDSSSVKYIHTRSGPFPYIDSELKNFPDGTTFAAQPDEPGKPTYTYVVENGLGCHKSALTCVQLPSVSMISGAPNPKETEIGWAMQRLAASRSLREAAEVKRSLPAESGLIEESEYRAASNLPGRDISLGKGRLFRDIKPAGERVFEELKNDPTFKKTIGDPALRMKLENSYKSLLEPLEGWIKDNYKTVLIKSSKEENGFYNKWIGYNDLSAKVDVRVLEHKGMTLGLAVKVGPGPESKNQWSPRYIYLQNPDPNNKELVTVIERVQQALSKK